MADGQQTTTPAGRRLAAIELASRSAATFRRTARRYSLCSDDAEDAYQRSLEILLTKAPTDDLRQLRPWLQTVVKHEALAVRAQRERMMGAEIDPALGETVPGPDDRAPERERARRTAEALGQLKRSEVQCMLLKALGYSYDEISGRTGYSFTKVNRSLSEGRKRFFDRFEQIDSGESCERLAPALTAAVGGDAAPDVSRELLVHVRGCASCRATLRKQRRQTVGFELLSPALLLPALRGNWWSRAQDALAGPVIDRIALSTAKLQQLAEAATVHKTAAVVASTAVLAGGVAAEQRVEVHKSSSRQAQRAAVHNARSVATSEAASRPEPVRDLSSPQPPPSPESIEQRRAPQPRASADQAAVEFAPSPAASPAQVEPQSDPAAGAPSADPAPATNKEFSP